MRFRLDRDYFKLVLIFGKLPVSGMTEKFCGGFPIAILTKYAYVTYMKKSLMQICKLQITILSFYFVFHLPKRFFLHLTPVDGVGVNSARQTPEESAL